MLHALLYFPADITAALLQLLLGDPRERYFSKWQSRLNYRDFAAGAPAFLAAATIVVLGGVWWVQNKTLSTRYSELASTSLREKDFDTAVVALERLAQERPGDQGVMLSLVAAYEGTGDEERAAALLQALAPTNSEGFHRAQLLSVRRKLRSSAALTAAELQDTEARLIRMRGHRDVEPEVSVLLADLYFQTDRATFVLNEPALRETAEGVPALRLKLLQTELQQGKVRPELARITAMSLMKHFSKELGAHPDDDLSRRALAQAQAITGDFAAASVTVQEGLALRPDDGRLKNMLVGLIFAHVQAESAKRPSPAKLEELARESTKIIERYAPLSELATLQFAQMLVMTGNLADAEKQFRKAAETLPAAKLDLAEMLLSSGRKADAHREYANILKDHDASDPAARATPLRLAIAGIAAARLGEYRRAVDDLKQASATLEIAKTTLVETYVAWSDQLSETEPDRSLQLLGESLKLQPYYAPAFSRMIARMGREDSSSEARKFVGEMITRSDAPATAYLMLGTDAARRGKREDALKYLEQASRLAPNAPIVMNNLAWTIAQGETPDLRRAVTICDAAIYLAPQDVHLRDTRGRILSKLGRFQEALSDLEKCSLAMDSDPEFHAVIADVYEKLGLHEPAAGHRLRIKQLQEEASK